MATCVFLCLWIPSIDPTSLLRPSSLPLCTTLLIVHRISFSSPSVGVTTPPFAFALHVASSDVARVAETPPLWKLTLTGWSTTNPGWKNLCKLHISSKERNIWWAVHRIIPLKSILANWHVGTSGDAQYATMVPTIFYTSCSSVLLLMRCGWG
jgi:hypothetical protein